MTYASNDTFHGMKVVSDHDCIAVRGYNVIETNSSNNLICRFYDKNGVEDDEPFEIDIFDFGPNPSEANITGGIKRQVGTRKLLISESAVKLIKVLAS